MPSVLYHIPDASTPLLTTLHSTLSTLSARSQPTRWTLDHKLYRSVPDAATPNAPSRQHHILTIPHLSPPNAPSTYLYATPDPAQPGGGTDTSKDLGRGSVIAIPAKEAQGFGGLLQSKLTALWAPKAAVQVVGGTVYTLATTDTDIPSFVIRMGELRSASMTGAATAGAGSGRGVVVQMETRRKEEEGKDGVEEEVVEEVWMEDLGMLKSLWAKLEVGNARETVMGRPIYKADEDKSWGKRQEEVRMWCEVLKGRS